MTDKEVLQMALEWVEWFASDDHSVRPTSKAREIAEAIKARLAQPDADAVAWVDEITLRNLKNGKEGVHLVYEVEMVNASIPLFEYPPEKEWVGLTDEEKLIAYSMYEQMGSIGFVQAIEAKLKEKNK